MTVASGVWSPMRSSRESSRSACSRTFSGISASAIFVAVLLDDGRLVLTELLADGVELPAQDVLALLLLDARLDVLLDAPPHLHERESLALELERELEPLADVDRLEELDLLLEGEVGRVAGRVGERAGLGDRADEGGDAPVVAAELEDLLDDGAVLALELADAAVRGLLVGTLLDLDEQASLRIGGRRARDPAVETVEGDRAPAAGKPDAVGHLGDGADLRVPVLVLGHEQDALLVADVDGQGDVHVREDDEVFQGDEQKADGVLVLDLVLAHDSRFRTDAIVTSETVPTTSRGLCREPRQPSVRRRRASVTRRDPPRETIRGAADAARPPRHDARDEDAPAPRRRDRCRGARSRSSPPCAAPRLRALRECTSSSFGRSRTCAVSHSRWRASAGVSPGCGRAKRTRAGRREPECAPESRHVPGRRVLARRRMRAHRRPAAGIGPESARVS